MFQTNLAVLRTHYEALAQVLEAENPLSLPSIFVSESSLNGAPTLTVEGQLIHSARNPLREAKRLVEGELKAAGSSEGAIVLLGFGLGYAAEAVLELESGRRLIIVEKRPAILRKALETRDLRYVFTSGKTIVVLGGHDGGILAALEAVQKVHAVIRNQTLIKLDAAWYTAVDQHIELWRNKDAVNMATLRRFGKRWVRNLGANLEAIRDFPGVNSLFDQFNFPVLLLAAGPSLDELRPYLDACRERCLVIAVDTAARFLQTAKIPADFIVSVDPQFWNLRHLDPLRTGDGGTCLIAEAATQPAALRLCRRTFLTSTVFPLGRFIEDAIGSKGILGAGGSVATSAFDAACLLRHDKTLPVFIAGLDLSYPALKTHYKGAHFEERALNIQYRFHPAEYETFSALHSAAPFWTEDRAGGKVLTDKRLGLYARWFEYKFSEQKNLPFYELSPHGRAIPGLKTASIDAIYAHPVCRKEIDLCKEKIFTALDAAWTRHEAKTARAERFNTAQLLLINSLKEIRAAAEKSARLAQKALSENCSSAETAQIYKLFEITNQLAENSPVKNIIQFLSPDSTIPKAPPNNYPDDLIEFHRYLKSSLEIYDQLAEIADFHIKAII